MTETPTVAQLLAAWHLGTDSIGRNATKALAESGVTPAAAARMTPAELAAVPGLGASRLERVRQQLGLILRDLLDERDALAARVEAAHLAIDSHDGPNSQFSEHWKWCEVRDALNGADQGTRAETGSG